MITTFCLVVCAWLYLNFLHPEIIYQYTDPVVHMIDIIVGVVFSVLGNYMIIMAFVHMYYRQLDKVEELAIRDSMTNLYNHVFAMPGWPRKLTGPVEIIHRFQLSCWILTISKKSTIRMDTLWG